MLSWENSQHFTESPGFPTKWHLSGLPPAPPPPLTPSNQTDAQSAESWDWAFTYLKVWICHCIWGTSIEIPYWWHVTSTTKIWVVVLIGWSKFSTNQEHYLDMGSDASSVWNLYVCCSDFIFLGNRWWRVKCWLLEASCFCSKCIKGPQVNYSVIFLPQF